jgi:hypothetical protein
METKSDCSKASEVSSYISEENDELTDDDKEFEESEVTNISDGQLILNNMLLFVILIDNNK